MLFNAPMPPRTGDRVRSDRAPLALGIILLPGFSLLSLAALLEPLRHAADDERRGRQINCSWTIMGLGQEPVPASCGARIAPWERLGDPQRFNYVAIIGGALLAVDEVDDAISTYLRDAAKRGTTLIGVGGGAATLAHAGLLRGRRCCVHWASYKDFAREFSDLATVGDQLFLIDGNRITCAGGAATADLITHLVERHCGRARAQTALNLMLIDGARSGHAAQPHPALTESVTHERVRRAIVLMEQAMEEPYSVEQIARRVNLSKRQLERLFQQEVGLSVQGFSRRLRLRYGLWRLLNSENSITEIAQRCGFADSSHFCRKFGEVFKRTPSEVRMKPDLGQALYAAMELIPQACEDRLSATG